MRQEAGPSSRLQVEPAVAAILIGAPERRDGGLLLVRLRAFLGELHPQREGTP
jgi:hypothetical protein